MHHSKDSSDLMIFPDHIPKPYSSVLSVNHSSLFDGKILLLSHISGNDIKDTQAKYWRQKVLRVSVTITPDLSLMGCAEVYFMLNRKQIPAPICESIYRELCLWPDGGNQSLISYKPWQV